MNTQKFDSAKLLSNFSRNSLMLHLTGRKYNGDLFSVTPTINKNVQKEIISLIEKQVSYYDNQNLKQYDIVGAIDDTVEYANSNDFIDKLNEIFSLSLIHIYSKKLIASLEKPLQSLTN